MNQLHRFILNCQETAQLLSDSLDRRLSVYARIRLYAHLRVCRLCQAYKHQLQLVRDLFKKNPTEPVDSEDSVPSGLSPEAKRRIVRAINSLRQ